MGYTTDFSGQFDCEPPLKTEHAAFLRKFSDTRRMRRDAEQAALLPDPIRTISGLPIGTEGANFVGGTGECGQGTDPSILDYNRPPAGQPGLHCDWTPNDDGTAIEWNQAEKFYNYVEWLEYLLDQYLKPWGYQLTGTVCWCGEDRDDLGQIEALGDKIVVRRGTVVYGDPQ